MNTATEARPESRQDQEARDLLEIKEILDLDYDPLPRGTELGIPGIGKIKIIGPLQPNQWDSSCLGYPVRFKNGGHESFIAAGLIHSQADQ